MKAKVAFTPLFGLYLFGRKSINFRFHFIPRKMISIYFQALSRSSHHFLQRTLRMCQDKNKIILQAEGYSICMQSHCLITQSLNREHSCSSYVRQNFQFTWERTNFSSLVLIFFKKINHVCKKDRSREHFNQTKIKYTGKQVAKSF